MMADREHGSSGSRDDVAVSRGLGAYLLAGLLMSFFVVSTILLTLILGPIFIEMVLGRRPADLFLLFVIPASIFTFAGLTLDVALRVRDFLRPTESP